MKLPYKLAAYIIEQEYEQYSRENFATWETALLKHSELLSCYSEIIDPKYISGFSMMELEPNKIPTVSELNQMVMCVGWSVACVDGYLSPET